MASTYTWSNIIDFVAPYVKNISTSALNAAACDHINSIIWRRFFWRWSLNNLTAISLTDGTQDYSISNTDFYRLAHVQITRTDTTVDVSRDMDLVEYLPPQLELKGNLDSIRAVAYVTTSSITDGIRLERAASVPSGTTYQIDGEYQQNPTKITSTSTTILFPDQYVDVAQEGILWKFYRLADDPRAGGQQVDRLGNVTYTGQYAVFQAALTDMVRQEDNQNADPMRFPGDGLGIGRGSNPGFLGWS